MFETLNAEGIPDHAIPVSFDIVIIFLSIDNSRSVAVVKSASNLRTKLSPWIECIVEALEICVTNSNLTPTAQHLMQTNKTAMGRQHILFQSQIFKFNQYIML